MFVQTFTLTPGNTRVRGVAAVPMAGGYEASDGNYVLILDEELDCTGTIRVIGEDGTVYECVDSFFVGNGRTVHLGDHWRLFEADELAKVSDKLEDATRIVNEVLW